MFFYINYNTVTCFFSFSMSAWIVSFQAVWFCFCNLLPGVLKQILALVQLDRVFYSPMIIGLCSYVSME